MKKVLIVMMLASLLLASCSNAAMTENSSVETVVTETSESTPESSSAKSSEETPIESEDESETVSDSSEVSQTESSVSESEPAESTAQTETTQTASVYTADVDLTAIGGDEIEWDYNLKFTSIPNELITYIGADQFDQWVQGDTGRHTMQTCINYFGLTKQDVLNALNPPESTDNILRMTVSDIDVLFSGDQAAINRAFVSDYAAVSESGDIYTIFWLAEHNAADYQAAGLSADAVASAIENCQTLGIEAVDAYCTQAQTALTTFEAGQ